MVADRSSPDDQNPRPAGEDALSFVICLTDDAVVKANLMASPIFNQYEPHEAIATRGPQCCGWAWSPRARNEVVDCVHQDVYLPAGWDRLTPNQYRMAERRFGPIGVAGVYGVGPVGDADGSGRGSAAGRSGAAPGDAAAPVLWIRPGHDGKRSTAGQAVCPSIALLT